MDEMRSDVEGCPFTYWVGMDTDPRTTAQALSEFNHFYSTTHVNEVIAAHPGFVRATRYELLDPDPRTGVHHGPRWLAIYDIADEAAVARYVKDNERPWLHRRRYSPWPAARRRASTVWRMIWHKLSVTGSTDQPPASIFVVGMNAPADAGDDDLAQFNDFYTTIHVPEVMAHAGYTRAARFELYREFAHPAPGCPRFCAVYDADAVATTEDESTGGARPALSPGPPVWERHETIWRLTYRRIPPPD